MYVIDRLYVCQVVDCVLGGWLHVGKLIRVHSYSYPWASEALCWSCMFCGVLPIEAIFLRVLLEVYSFYEGGGYEVGTWWLIVV